MRRRPWRLAGLLCLLLALQQPALAAGCAGWSDWQRFKDAMLSEDGRVVDRNTPQQHTVSEGQAYALFFALVAGERKTFAQLLEWTENNLAAGDLTARLPAWQWGRLDDGRWGVIDANPASDADLWIAYALGEAGRLWDIRRYRILSALIAARVLREETAAIPGLGLTLLPGPVGFAPERGLWRLNPSYVPLQLMRWFAAQDAAPAWQSLVGSSVRLLHDSAPRGYSPDWALYRAGQGFLPDVETRAAGSYNSIRTYLWAGMLAEEDPERAALLRRLQPMLERTVERGAPPEVIDTVAGTFTNDGPPGFSGAMLPMLAAAGRSEALQRQRQRSLDAGAVDYYDGVLNLFGRGWVEGRYRFDADGRLRLPENSACFATSLS